MFALGGNGQSPAVKLKTWQNVPLTPGRIPSFYVPSKLHLSVSPRFRKHKDVDEYQLLPPSSPETSSPGSRSPSPSPRFPIKLRFTPLSNRRRLKEDTCDPSRKKESCPSPAFSSASPKLRDSPASSMADQRDKPSPELCCSAQKSERKRLKVLYNKTQTALKSLTPRSRKTHVGKVQDVL